MCAFSRESMSGFIGFSFACELWYRLSGKTEWRHGFVSSRADETCTLSMRCFIGNSHTIEIPRYRQPARQRYATLSTTRALRKRHLHSVWTITAPPHPQESVATNTARSDSQGHALQTEPPPITNHHSLYTNHYSQVSVAGGVMGMAFKKVTKKCVFLLDVTKNFY